MQYKYVILTGVDDIKNVIGSTEEVVRSRPEGMVHAPHVPTLHVQV